MTDEANHGQHRHDPVAAALRSALEHEADGVTPGTQGLTQIRAAIRERESSRWWAPGAGRTLGLAAAAAAVVAAVLGVSATITGGGSDGGPAGRPSIGVTSPSPAPSSRTAAGLPVYYPGVVGQSYALFREFHPAGDARDVAQRVQAAVSQAMSQRPDDPDYLVLWAAGADARTRVTGELITITLNEAAAGGTSVAGSGADAIVLQQLIWTATAAAAPATGSSSPARVLIRADGPTPARFGSIDLAQAFTRGGSPGPGEPRAPVWIDSLGQNATVRPGPLTVRGQGVGGPYALRWTLTRNGATADSGSVRPVSASGAALDVGERGQWAITVQVPATGRYTLTVAQDVPADGAGGGDSKDFIAASS